MPPISLDNALRLTLAAIKSLGSETVELAELAGRVTAEGLSSQADSPSADVSLKDGYAVFADDIQAASEEMPVTLRLAGSASAGDNQPLQHERGTAIRILSGARLPTGADAILAEEFTRVVGDQVIAGRDARPGRNVLFRGSDLARGQFLLPAGIPLEPAEVGLLAAAGYARVPVTRIPRVAILATGSEVVAPGASLAPGKLYPSNLANLSAWCRRLGMAASTRLAPDEPEKILACLEELAATHDALLTSGGAWSGERDLVVGLLEKLGWTEVYHRVRIGPGKAVGFGLLDGKPVFCLPGGPPSNYLAFIYLALPGLLKLGGRRQPDLPSVPAVLAEEITGQIDWTQLILGRLELQEGRRLIFYPQRGSARLPLMAQAQAVLAIPEGVDRLPAGTEVLVKTLSLPVF